MLVLGLIFIEITRGPLSPMADDAITEGGMRGLGSLFYICWPNISKFGLTKPLHGAIFEVWDLPCISVDQT